MDKDFLLKLTNNLYRLTLLFPKKEPLRYKMREVADDILAKSAENCSPRVLEELEVLDSFFEVAKNQNWVSSSGILAIQKEYANLREELTKKIDYNLPSTLPLSVGPSDGPLQVPFPEERSGVNERQEKILAFLRENGRVQVWQVKQILPEVSKRTLRRDFENMLNQGIVERMGERNDTFYQLKISKS